VVLLTAMGLAGYQFRDAVHRFVSDHGSVQPATDNSDVTGSLGHDAAQVAIGDGQRPAPAPAFAVLAREDKPERPFATLAAAVAAADDGDAIEVRGDGPFVSPALKLGNKALTIRAAPGSWPVFQLHAAAANAMESLLQTDAPLVLEGLEFHCPERRNAQPGRYLRLILAPRAPLHVANCRFVVKGDNADVIVLAYGSATCEVRNCQFVGAIHSCLDWRAHTAGRLVLDNCVAVGPGHGVSFSDRETDLDTVSLDAAQNTLVTYRPIHFALDAGVPGRPAERPAPVARLNATGNIVHGGDAAFGFSVENERQPLQAAEIQAQLGRLLSWHDQRNLYAEGVPFLVLGSNLLRPTIALKSQSDWEAFWGLQATDSLQARIRYEGGDLRARLASTPEQITPADFRLHPESAGYRAGEDGRDLGADVDLVGPGPAYERWQQTPAYEQWHKGTGEGMRDGGN
jgi:hypothetical protein